MAHVAHEPWLFSKDLFQLLHAQLDRLFTFHEQTKNKEFFKIQEQVLNKQIAYEEESQAQFLHRFPEEAETNTCDHHGEGDIDDDDEEFDDHAHNHHDQFSDLCPLLDPAYPLTTFLANSINPDPLFKQAANWASDIAVWAEDLYWHKAQGDEQLFTIYANALLVPMKICTAKFGYEHADTEKAALEYAIKELVLGGVYLSHAWEVIQKFQKENLLPASLEHASVDAHEIGRAIIKRVEEIKDTVKQLP